MMRSFSLSCTLLHRAALGTQFQQQIRGKHSSTQVKRLFNQNPARRRVLLKQQQKELPLNEKETPALLSEPRFPQVFQPVFLSNGWSAPPESSSVDVSVYPFHVARTANKPSNAVGFLPVYTDFRIGGTKVTTIIRKTTGDLNMLVKELEIYLRQNHPTSKTPEMQIRTGGSVVVNGNYSREIRRWLAGLGF